MPASPAHFTRFWRPQALGGAEFLFASYGRHAFPRHSHEEYVVALMVRGAERLRHGRGADVAPVGGLILINPGVVHENGAVDDAGFAYRTMYVPVPLARRLLEGAGRGAAGPGASEPAFDRAVASDRGVAASLLRLHSAVQAGEPSLRLQTLLAALVPVLFTSYASVCAPAEPARPGRRAITTVREYLDAHFAQDVSLDDLSRLVGLSPFHLLRSFRDHVGMPPCHYQIHRRVLHAARRLREGAPIVVAACEAGFADQSHLNRHFKRHLGVTPGQFRTDRNIVQDRRA